MPSNRLNRITVSTLSALAITAPIAVAAGPEPVGQLASFGAHDAAQISADDTTPVLAGGSDRSDAAQLSADENAGAVVRVLDRSDAAQRTPGETLPAVALVSAATPALSVDDGFDWGAAAIGAGTVLALTVLGVGAGAVSRRRHVPLAS